MKTPKAERPRLFWQVYLHGGLLLLMIAIALGATAWLIGRPPVRIAYREWLAGYLEARAPEIDGDALRLERDIARERELAAFDVTVYRKDGRLVATNVTPPLPPIAPHDAESLEPGSITRSFATYGVVVPVARDGRVIAYALARPKPALPHLVHAFVALSIVLLVLAVASIPLARAISAPVERLTEAAERLGRGDLGARTGLPRKGELGRLAGAFDEMAEKLERLVRGEQELLANISHELRTPIARIRVALELATEGDEARARRALTEIESDLTELDALVADVLTAARLDLATGATTGATPLRLVPLAGRALIDEAAARFRERHPDRTLVVDIRGPLPELLADPALLRRALDNLLDNARKYSDEAAPVDLAARSDPWAASGGDGSAVAALVVEVRDRGIGIDPADLAQVFTPFFRSDRSRNRGTGGVGLGLALAKRIVEAHGGTIGVRSGPDEGTMVHFVIPSPTR